MDSNFCEFSNRINRLSFGIVVCGKEFTVLDNQTHPARGVGHIPTGFHGHQAAA